MCNTGSVQWVVIEVCLEHTLVLCIWQAKTISDIVRSFLHQKSCPCQFPVKLVPCYSYTWRIKSYFVNESQCSNLMSENSRTSFAFKHNKCNGPDSLVSISFCLARVAQDLRASQCGLKRTILFWRKYQINSPIAYQFSPRQACLLPLSVPQIHQNRKINMWKDILYCNKLTLTFYYCSKLHQNHSTGNQKFRVPLVYVKCTWQHTTCKIQYSKPLTLPEKAT